MNILVLMLASTLLSCQKEEPLWELPPPGPETQAKVSMGPEYEHMVYFKFSNGNTIKKEVRNWDLAFASGADERYITLNGGNEVQAYLTHDTILGKSYSDPEPNDWQWDNPNGDPDSTAIGCWYDPTTGKSKGEVYLLGIGQGGKGPVFQMVVLSADSEEYRVRIWSKTTGGGKDFVITKNKASNFTYFSLRDLAVTDIEPPSTEWDIVFTKYRYVYYDMVPITPYYVCGALLNRNKCKVVEVRNRSFEAMDKTAASNLVFTRKVDEIGYDWKLFDLAALRYTVRPNQFFVVQDADGFLYKLKFVDFYDGGGQKGFPTFLYQRL